MLKNYLIIALRTIRKQRGYSFINIAGLAIGMAVCMLILLWVFDELSYDRYHANADRIYRVCFGAEGERALRSAATMAPAGPAMAEEYLEVVDAVRISIYSRVAVKYQDKLFQGDILYFADKTLFDVFSFQLISGNPKTALEAPYSVVLSEDMAEKYFGNENPLGKSILIDGQFDCNVTGIMKNIPRNSHFTCDMFGSFETLRAIEYPTLDNWLSIEFRTYLLLAENSDYKLLESKFPALLEKNAGDQIRAFGRNIYLYLQPLTDIHLRSKFTRHAYNSGDMATVYLFSGIALFVLLIACINFINLSTARSASRAQEVGMRKTLGAVRTKLIFQFLGESVLFCLFAFILAGLIVMLVLPSFNNLIDRDVSIHLSKNIWFILSFFGLALVTGIFAGIYPAYVLSSFSSVKVLKGITESGVLGARFRRVLVVFQFVISIALIIGSLTVYRQLTFIQNKKLGFEKEQVLVIPDMNDATRQVYRSFQNDLKNINGILDVSASSLVPGVGNLIGAFTPEGFDGQPPQRMDYMNIDYNYIPMMDMKIVEGRNFSAELSTDVTSYVLINQTAAKLFGWDEPIGKKFIFAPPPGVEGETRYSAVVGVVNNFHRTSLHRTIEPLIIFHNPERFNFLSIKISTEDVPHLIRLIEQKWAEIEPDRPMRYFFLDERLDNLYRNESRFSKIALYFTLLTVFIGCLGLFGLASFMAEKRTKEIGIRKVFGATSRSIVALLSKEFILIILLSNFISWPIAYFCMNWWLQNFAYRINPHFSTFILAGLMAAGITMITVSYQSIKAALSNPIDAIRYE